MTTRPLSLLRILLESLEVVLGFECFEILWWRMYVQKSSKGKGGGGECASELSVIQETIPKRGHFHAEM